MCAAVGRGWVSVVVASVGGLLLAGCAPSAGGGGDETDSGEDLCHDVTCPSGQQCDPTTGACEDVGGEGEGEGEGEDNDNQADADAVVDDDLAAGLIEVPDPLSGDNPVYALEAAAVPQPGESVTDSGLGTTQTRVTQTESLRHEYSRYDAFNRDGSMIMLIYFPEGDVRVYRTDTVPYDGEENLVMTLNVEEPRWDPDDPDVIWGLRDFEVVTVNVGDAQTTTVKDFAADATIDPIVTANPDLYRITRHFEGESSRDKRYWVFALQGTDDDYRDQYIFTWDRQQDAVLGVYTLSVAESSIDWVGMSPLGNWVLIGADFDNAAPLTGLTLADRELTEFHQLGHATAHADVGLDTDGNEVIVMQNTRTDHVDLIPLDPATRPVDEDTLSYAGTNRVPLMRLFYDSESPIGFSSGVHVSCNAFGWCVVSTYIEPGQPEQNWLDRTIAMIRLDPEAPAVFHVAKVYGTTGAYWEETQASISNDGSRIIWATNWGQNVGEERVWVVQTDLPVGE